MAATLAGNIKVSADFTYSNALDLTTTKDVISQAFSNVFTSGTGDDQVDLIWHDQRTVSASSTDSLDLAGSLSDAFGNTLTFVELKGIIIRAASGNTNNVVVGGNANPVVGWVSDATDEIVIKPGGLFCLTAPGTGHTVTASTGDILDVANSGAGASVTYDIILIGASA